MTVSSVKGLNKKTLEINTQVKHKLLVFFKTTLKTSCDTETNKTGNTQKKTTRRAKTHNSEH